MSNLRVWILPVASSSPSPLDEKENAISEVLESKEVKAGVSETIDSESKRQTESAGVGDSEKRDLDSEKLEPPQILKA